MKYKCLLMEIDRDIRTMGRTLQPGCTSNQIDQLVKSVREMLGTTLPEDYIQFLSYTNGLMYNGLMIYSSQETVLQGRPDVCIWGIVEANLLHRSDPFFNDFLVFGQGNMDYYALYLPDNSYRIIDRVPGNVIDTLRSFEDLLVRAIADNL
jgi:SMI1 / KNR4 family.